MDKKVAQIDCDVNNVIISDLLQFAAGNLIGRLCAREQNRSQLHFYHGV